MDIIQQTSILSDLLSLHGLCVLYSEKPATVKTVYSCTVYSKENKGNTAGIVSTKGSDIIDFLTKKLAAVLVQE